VKFHLQNIYQKLGVANRTEAAGIYFKLRQEGRR
jgi:DNA-binding NarL/FixJ family response regulator